MNIKRGFYILSNKFRTLILLKYVSIFCALFCLSFCAQNETTEGDSKTASDNFSDSIWLGSSDFAADNADEIVTIAVDEPEINNPQNNDTSTTQITDSNVISYTSNVDKNFQGSYSSGSFTLIYKGETYNLTELDQNGPFIYAESIRPSNIRYRAYAISTDNIDLVGWTHYRRASNNGVYIEYQGQTSTTLPSLISSYGGYYLGYTAAAGTQGPYRQIEITLEVDFQSGTLIGFDTQRYDIISLEGNIDENTLTARLYGPHGYMDVSGYFFGDDGQEVLATGINGGRASIIYAEYDQERSELLQARQ